MSVLPPIGAFYIPNFHGIAWTQPGGPGTKVFPAQNDGAFAGFPILGAVISEAGESLWHSPCQHGFDCAEIFRDYDDSTHMSAAIVCCPLCSVINRIIEPYESIDDVVTMPIVVP